MAQEDVKLTYDPTAFINAINKVSDTMDNFASNSEAVVGKLGKVLENKVPDQVKKGGEKTKKNAKSVSKGIMNAFGKLALLGGIVAAGFGAIKSAMNSIPEIGMTFKAVGAIVQKNLLWPLRQQLIPILQRVLDWTRNNRAMFVKWGGVLVNIFKTASTIFGIIVRIVNKVTKSIMSIFGVTGKSIIKTINILTFKITGIFLLLESKVEGIIGNIFKIFSESMAAKSVMSFVDGFVKGFSKVKGLNKSFNTLFSTLTKIFRLMVKLSSVIGSKLSPLFSNLGSIIGSIVGGALKLLLDTLTNIGGVIEKLLNFSIGKIDSSKKPKPRKVGDAVMRPDGSVVETDPRDTLVAMKNPERSLRGMSRQQSTVQIDMGNINITVTEGNAKQAGANFAEGIQEQMRRVLLDQRVLKGDR